MLIYRVQYPNRLHSFYAFTVHKAGKFVNGLKSETRLTLNSRYHHWFDFTSTLKSELKKIKKNQNLLKLFNQEIRLKSRKLWRNKKRLMIQGREDMTQAMFKRRQKELTVTFHKLYSFLHKY